MESPEKCCGSQFKVLSCGDYILPPLLQESVNKIVQNEGYISHKILNRSVSTSGGNYLAELYEVDIKGETAEGAKETNIFIKNKMEDAVSVVDVEEAYSLETLFYSEISRFFDKLQNKANIPQEERFTAVKSYDASNPDAIILENLAKKGFTTCDRFNVVPLKFTELSVQQLARFHGLSFVLEKQYPEYFEKRIKPLKSPFIINEEYDAFYCNMANYTIESVDDDAKMRLKKFVPGAVEKMRKYFFDESINVGVPCCLCHGDYRANNILMKEENGEVTAVVPVDYQLLHYGCPVLDFLYFIFPCTDLEFRKKHLNDLKNLYHESLTKFLTYFDMDVESVFPRHQFEALYKERLDHGLIISLLLTPVLFTDDSDVPSFTDGNLDKVTVTPVSGMKERVVGLVQEFIEWGIL